MEGRPEEREERREPVRLHDAAHEAHLPRGGRWALLAGASVAGIPVVAVAPDSWTMPLVAASLVLLVASVVALTVGARGARRTDTEQS